MNRAEPWQTAEIPGPKKALVISKPEIVAGMVKRAKRPILIVGHKASETEIGEEKMIDYLIRFAEVSNVTVVATAHVVKEFVNRGFQPATWMPIVDIANRLKDAEWKGLDGKGRYDLALFVGIPYYMEWLILSGLKHFSSELKTVSLDKHYQPHASWSFPNITVEKWKENLDVIVDKLKQG
ncbi:CO dehydrogenase/acetyl-CoA synthase complex subunit epsilon [Candidatus Bathyarchaeota archaeon ex4484_231]|nr:MAG: CO dehydrogenase/acetyl-CoA synthase complex subunit epsilon [Candidatus Bathyarchaeota archaeon ex4484_231]RJS74591.1 MAG: CO dehydrogenase/acetyl-CoA synthase complex subunit epsilon [Candidatus Bathyarchaeota archaeon]